MSLGDFQRDRARHTGGKEIADRKRHVSQLETGLRNLVADCERRSNTEVGYRTADVVWDVVSVDELKALQRAAEALHKVAASLDKAAAEAKRIKADYDAHVEQAQAALGKLPKGVADIVALSACAQRTPVYHWTLERMRARPREVLDDLNDIRREAISTLAHRCAREGIQPAGFADTIRLAMPAAAEKHAALIGELNALAVAAQLEKSA